ncbi:MAG: hypothetical protein R6W84_04185 [Promethearchaeia archaeon]
MPLHWDYSESLFPKEASEDQKEWLFSGVLMCPLEAISRFLYNEKIGSYCDRGEHMLKGKYAKLEEKDIEKIINEKIFIIKGNEEKKELKEMLNMLIGLKVWGSR